jgi:hypothetical protein
MLINHGYYIRDVHVLGGLIDNEKNLHEVFSESIGSHRPSAWQEAVAIPC